MTILDHIATLCGIIGLLAALLLSMWPWQRKALEDEAREHRRFMRENDLKNFPQKTRNGHAGGRA